MTYQISDASSLYSPKPTIGGIANSNAMPHNFKIYGEDQKLLRVCECQNLSKRTTDEYLTPAMLTTVNNELSPSKKLYNKNNEVDIYRFDQVVL